MINKTKKKQYKKEDIIAYRLSLEKRGIRTYNVSSFVRSSCGVGCIIVGFTTSLIPFTSIPLYIIGGGLLGIDVISLYYSIKKIVKYEIRLKVLTASARLKELLW
jgi:hypothetical protein